MANYLLFANFEFSSTETIFHKLTLHKLFAYVILKQNIFKGILRIPNMVEEKVTTIKLKESTKKRLDQQGAKGDSYDDILRKLMNIIENKERAKKDGNR